MRQGSHRFSSLPKIQKGLTKLIKNPKRFCNISNTTNVQCLGGSPGHCTSQHRLAPALHICRIGNIAKPLWILYQLSKLLLNFGQGRKSVTTLPHLMCSLFSIFFLFFCSLLENLEPSQIGINSKKENVFTANDVIHFILQAAAGTDYKEHGMDLIHCPTFLQFICLVSVTVYVWCPRI